MSKAQHDIEVEKIVLSTLINYPEKCPQVCTMLKADFFYYLDHRTIFQAINHLTENGEVVGVLGIRHKVRETGLLDNVMRDKIDGIPENKHDLAGLNDNVRILVELWKIRESSRLNEKLKDAIQQSTPYHKLKEIISDFGMLDIVEGRDKPENTESIISKIIMETEEALKTGESRFQGLKFGFKKIDRHLRMRPGNTYCIAGRPAMGKSSFMRKIILNLILEGKRMYLNSSEMTKEEIVECMISTTQSISSEDFRALPDKEKLARYKEISSYILSRSADLIIDSGVNQLYDITHRMRMLHREKPLDAGFLDYLQQFEVEDNENRNLAIGEITRKFKVLSNELYFPIVELSQLNRKLEDRADKRPRMSDLRESGNIEQDMTSILFLYRPIVYGVSVDEDGNDISDQCEIIIAKNRFGKTGKAIITFDGETTNFYDK